MEHQIIRIVCCGEIRLISIVYGHHPFYLEKRGKTAHGVFLLNSNAQDVELTQSKLTWIVSCLKNVDM